MDPKHASIMHPPSTPQAVVLTVLPYATSVMDPGPAVDPRLRFIGRLSIWLGVTFTLLGLLFGFVCGVALSVDDDTPYLGGMLFWCLLLACCVMTVFGAITLLVAAKTSRRASLTAARMGGVCLLIGLISTVILYTYDVCITRKYDTFAAIALLLGFAAICCRLLIACRAFDREQQRPTAPTDRSAAHASSRS